MESIPQTDRWIEQLKQLNQQQYLPRRKSNNQRTTFKIDRALHPFLKQLQSTFRVNSEWKAFNCILITCLQSLESGDSIQNDRIVIPYLKSNLHWRLTLPENECSTIAIHRSAKPIVDLLKKHFHERTDWQVFNRVLIHCLSGNERLIAECKKVFAGEVAA